MSRPKQAPAAAPAAPAAAPASPVPSAPEAQEQEVVKMPHGSCLMGAIYGVGCEVGAVPRTNIANNPEGDAYRHPHRDNVLELLLPAMGRWGLAMTTLGHPMPTGDPGILIELMHLPTGESLKSTWPLLIDNPRLSAAQALASSVTMTVRIALIQLFNLRVVADDDGAMASEGEGGSAEDGAQFPPYNDGVPFQPPQQGGLPYQPQQAQAPQQGFAPPVYAPQPQPHPQQAPAQAPQPGQAPAQAPQPGQAAVHQGRPKKLPDNSWGAVIMGVRADSGMVQPGHQVQVSTKSGQARGTHVIAQVVGAGDDGSAIVSYHKQSGT